MMPRLPKPDGYMIYLSLALAVMTTQYLYLKFAIPHILRWIEIALH